MVGCLFKPRRLTCRKYALRALLWPNCLVAGWATRHTRFPITLVCRRELSCPPTSQVCVCDARYSGLFLMIFDGLPSFICSLHHRYERKAESAISRTRTLTHLGLMGLRNFCVPKTTKTTALLKLASHLARAGPKLRVFFCLLPHHLPRGVVGQTRTDTITMLLELGMHPKRHLNTPCLLHNSSEHELRKGRRGGCSKCSH